MKNFLFLFGIIFLFGSCKKEQLYPENPKTGRSFDPVEELIGRWVVEEFTVDGIDSTESMIFPPDWIYDFSKNPDNTLGILELQDTIQLSGKIYPQKEKNGKLFVTHLNGFVTIENSGQPPIFYYLPPKGPFLNNSGVDWDIIKLINDEFKCSTSYNAKNYTLFMKKQ